MLFDTFSTQAAQASLDSLWMNTKVIANNIANESTPGYKAQRVSFEQVLSEASRAKGQGQVDDPNQTQSGSGESSGGAIYRSHVTTDSARSSRLDGNNVSMEKEQSELWKSYAQYSYLLDRVSGHYSSINAAISNMRI